MRINVALLQSEMESRKMRKADFARLIGVRPDTLHKIMRTESTTLKRVSQIASAIEIDPHAILIE